MGEDTRLPGPKPLSGTEATAALAVPLKRAVSVTRLSW